MDPNFAHFSSFLIQGAVLGITAAAMPGPFQTYLINQTLTGGWRSSNPLPFVPLVSDPPIILFAILVINQIPANFSQILNLAGGTFVLYVVWGLWHDWRLKYQNKVQYDLSSDVTSSDVGKANLPWRMLWKGSLMNLLSPGPYMFWGLVLGPILLGGWQSSPVFGIAFLIGFYISLIGGMFGIVILFHQTRRLGERVIQLLILLSILILFIIGFFLIIEGLQFG
jgi:threonine/homoserine/homoserine lactone efflux protein